MIRYLSAAGLLVVATGAWIMPGGWWYPMSYLAGLGLWQTLWPRVSGRLERREDPRPAR